MFAPIDEYIFTADRSAALQGFRSLRLLEDELHLECKIYVFFKKKNWHADAVDLVSGSYKKINVNL